MCAVVCVLCAYLDLGIYHSEGAYRQLVHVRVSANSFLYNMVRHQMTSPNIWSKTFIPTQTYSMFSFSSRGVCPVVAYTCPTVASHIDGALVLIVWVSVLSLHGVHHLC